MALDDSFAQQIKNLLEDEGSSPLLIQNAAMFDMESRNNYNVPALKTLMKNLERTYKIHKKLPKELLLDVTDDKLKELVEELIKAKSNQKEKFKVKLMKLESARPNVIPKPSCEPKNKKIERKPLHEIMEEIHKYERDLLAAREELNTVKQSNTVKSQILRLNNDKKALMKYSESMYAKMKKSQDELIQLQEDLAKFKTLNEFRIGDKHFPHVEKDEWISKLIEQFEDTHRFEEYVYLLLADRDLPQIIHDIIDYVQRIEDYIVLNLRREIHTQKSQIQIQQFQIEKLYREAPVRQEEEEATQPVNQTTIMGREYMKQRRDALAKSKFASLNMSLTKSSQLVTNKLANTYSMKCMRTKSNSHREY